MVLRSAVAVEVGSQEMLGNDRKLGVNPLMCLYVERNLSSFYEIKQSYPLQGDLLCAELGINWHFVVSEL